MTHFPSHIFFLGIGGIGMSALARFFIDKGHQVYGYDRSSTDLCSMLSHEGATIIYNEKDLPEEWNVPFAGNAMVVRTPAVREDNPLLTHFRNSGYPVLKRSEVLGRISSSMRCLAIAGTHGKTTTSAMLAHLFHFNKRKVYAFLGGIATNYNSNYLRGDEDTVVVEADEYDRSFLHLSPNTAVITNTDNDHLDIYKDADTLLEGFRLFANKTRENGRLLVKHGIGFKADYTYSATDYKADFTASNIGIVNGVYHFDIQHPHGSMMGIQLPMPGMHNVENAVAAAAIAFINGLSSSQIRYGLNTFRGVHRRFAWHLRSDNNALIDDYAHHPTELEALIATVRDLYPGKRLALLFQPHLYSRTRDFAADFAQRLDAVDEPALLPVYAARETPEQGVDSTHLLGLMENPNATCLHPKQIAAWLDEAQPDVVVTAGAGDIDQYLPVALAYLHKKTAL